MRQWSLISLCLHQDLYDAMIIDLFVTSRPSAKQW